MKDEEIVKKVLNRLTFEYEPSKNIDDALTLAIKLTIEELKCDRCPRCNETLKDDKDVDEHIKGCI